MNVFEINPLSTWLNERGKVRGERSQKIKNSMEVGNEKRDLANRPKCSDKVRIRNKASGQETN